MRLHFYKINEPTLRGTLALLAFGGWFSSFLSPTFAADNERTRPTTESEKASGDEAEGDADHGNSDEVNPDFSGEDVDVLRRSRGTVGVGLAEPPPVGAYPATAPRAAPGMSVSVATTAISHLRQHLIASDTARARTTAEAIVSSKKSGRERDLSWFVLGMLHREAQRLNLAAEAFERVRVANGPLAPLASWYGASTDLNRGKSTSAIRACTRYREKWPKGTHAPSCERVLALGHASLGHDALATDAAQDWDEKNPKAPIGEQVALRLAMRKAVQAPTNAVSALQKLSVDFQFPLTGHLADRQLEALRARGIAGAAPRTEIRSLQLRALSLKASARRREAWAAFEQLRHRAADDPSLQKWVADTARSFGWNTHQFGFVGEWYVAQYKAEGKPEDAWSASKAFGRAGRWQDAAAWARLGLSRHASHRSWRHKEEELARTFLLAGAGHREPTPEDQLVLREARHLFATVTARGGIAGRRAEFYEAFAAYLADDFTEAQSRFDAIVTRARENELEARYWRSRMLDARADTVTATHDRRYEGSAHGFRQQAQQDRAWIQGHYHQSWYGLLVAQRREQHPKNPPFARGGRWPGPELPSLPAPHPRFADPDAEPATAAWAPQAILQVPIGFSSWIWGTAAIEPTTVKPPAPMLAFRDLLAPPPSYVASGIYDPADSEKRLRSLATSHGSWAPELLAIRDLVDAGLYDLAGPMFATFYEHWRERLRAGDPMARKIQFQTQEWRSLFLAVRDHHHTARFLANVPKLLPRAEDRFAAVQLGWPLAHDRFVWSNAETYDVDPYLVLALMRQESTYSPIAESPVGARGAMQIMPRTGHLLAYLRNDADFTAGDLEDPILSVGYGIGYLSLLLDRFGGAMPLAVASYNGGPHNVSAWLAGTGLDIPMDEFVELIPYRETRDYVKRVSGNYSTYLAIYAPHGTEVRLPTTPSVDDATIVDF